MSDNIPLEIQMEIMKRLPVKSLFQFRSVSKSWKSLIDSTQFIADYYVCQTRPQRLFIRYTYESDSKNVCIIDDNSFPQHKFDITVPTSFEQFDDLRLVGSSQGLFCFLGHYKDGDSFRDTAFIWNPAIRKSIAIDVPVLYDRQDRFLRAPFLGFGVCPNTNDPMLVVITELANETSKPAELVFTLSSRVWRSRRSNLPRKFDGLETAQLVIDGFIYWTSNWDEIVSFDMTSEEFSEVNTPLVTSIHRPISEWHISKLRESLVVVEHCSSETKKPVCVVWKMEHGVSKSYTRLFTVTTPNACSIEVLGLRNNGEAILEASTDDHEEAAVLLVYEPCSGHIKDLGIHGQSHSFLMSSYTETLLLLDEPDNQHIKIKIV